MQDSLRRHLTFANVAAATALFIALGGVALAANSSLIGSNGEIKACANKRTGELRAIKSGAKCKKKETTLSWSQKGPKGDTGAAGSVGAPGAPGQQGIQGIQGSASASAVFGGVQNLSTLTAGASVITNPADFVGTTPEPQNILTPNAAVTLGDLAVQNGANLPANVSLKFTLSTSSSSITCTIATGTRTCNSGAQTATAPPASEISMTIQNTGTVTYGSAPTVEFGWRATG